MGSPLKRGFSSRGRLAGRADQPRRHGAARWAEETTARAETARAATWRRKAACSALESPSYSFVSRQGSEKGEKNNSIPHGRIGLKKSGNINPSKQSYKASSSLRKFLRAETGAAKFPKGGGTGGPRPFHWAVVDIWSSGHPAPGPRPDG